MALTLLTTLWNRIDSAPASDIANGNGFGGFESEIFLQGTFGTGGSGGRKVDNNTRAYGVGPTSLTAPFDLTNRHYCVYIGSNIWAGLTEVSGYNVDNAGAGVEGMHAYIDTGGTLITDGTEADRPSNNGWILLWVDPSRTEDGSGTGNPNITNTEFLGASWSGGNVGGGNTPNCFIDSIFVSSTATQPGGYAFTGTATATPIEDLSSTEGNGSTGYQGTLFEADGVYYFYARWYIGRTSEAAGTTATTFSESDRTIVFVSQRTVADDWSGWTIDLGNASTSFSLTNSNYQNSIVGDAGGGTTDPTKRPDLQFIGTAGSATITNCAVLGLRLAEFTSAVTMTGGSLDVKDLNQNGATINGVDITSRVASGTALGTQSDFTFGTGTGTLENCLIKQPGNNSYGHFVEFTTGASGQTFEFYDLTFEGQYLGVTTGEIAGNTGTADACIHNSSGGTVTINVVGGSIPSVRNTNGSTTIVNVNVNVTISGILGNSEVSVLENPSPYTQNGATPVSLFNEDVVAAVTGTDIELDTGGGANITQILSTTTDFTDITGLAVTTPRQVIRVTQRSDISKFDEFEVTSISANALGVTAVGGGNFVASTAQLQDLVDSPGETTTVERTKSSYSFSIPVNDTIDILVYRVGSLPFYILSQTITNDNSSFPISQALDRNYDGSFEV